MLLLLHTRGAKTLKQRINPLQYLPVDGGYAVFASKRGAPTNPDWYYNIIAKPDVTIEVGAETIPVTASIAEDGERERIWNEQKRRAPGFADYEKATSRTIPVIVLQSRSWRRVRNGHRDLRISMRLKPRHQSVKISSLQFQEIMRSKAAAGRDGVRRSRD